MIQFLSITADVIIVGTVLITFIAQYRKISAAQKEKREHPLQ